MNLYYFGADDTWENLVNKGFTRRNTNILKELTKRKEFENVYVVKRTIKTKLIKEILTSKGDGKIKDIFYASLLKENNKTSKRINSILAKFQISLQTRQKPSNQDIIWSYWPYGHECSKYVNLKGYKVFDSDHNIIENENVDDKKKRSKLLKKIAENSNLILSSSRSMINWFNEKGFSNTYFLRNGVDPSRFKKKEKKTNKLIIGYCGSLSRWIDQDILVDLIKNNPQYTFRIIGKSYKTDISEILKNHKNVELMGEKNSSEVTKIMNTFDVGLVLYKNNKGNDVDSMKIYEYLAANVPVVSTNFREHLNIDFENNIYISNGVKELENNIQIALKEKIDIKKVQHFLNKSTWTKRVEEIIQYIQNEK